MLFSGSGNDKNFFLAIFLITILPVEVKMHFTSFVCIAFFTDYVVFHQSDFAIVKIEECIFLLICIFSVFSLLQRSFARMQLTEGMRG